MNRSRSSLVDSGQATVEFALILPLFVLLIVAIFDVTGIVRDQLLADALARDAARQASHAVSYAEARQVVGDTVAATGRSDARWRLELHETSLIVEVSLVPRTSLITSSLSWFGDTRQLVGSSTFATEYDITDQ